MRAWKWTAGLAFVALNALSITMGARATPEDSWNNLGKVTRKRFYTVIQKDGKCATGKIDSVKDDLLFLKPAKGSIDAIPRAGVIQVNTGPIWSRIVYSGRSSWQDVRNSRNSASGGVRISRTTGSGYEGKYTSVSDAEIALQDADGAHTIRKAEIATVDILVPAPLSEGNEYWASEMCDFAVICALNPAVWPLLLGRGTFIMVRLYDLALPEDNSTLTCKGAI